MSDLTWRCKAHDVDIDGDCPKCDDELIALTEETTGPSCRVCNRVLLEGETAWADDWKVLDLDGSVRTEVRYTCDDCAVST